MADGALSTINDTRALLFISPGRGGRPSQHTGFVVSYWVREWFDTLLEAKCLWHAGLKATSTST